MDFEPLTKLKNGKYYVVDLKADGSLRENSENAYKLLSDELRNNKYTDVVVISHGWNTRRSKADGSIELANKVVAEMQRRKPENVNALYIAVSWPSVTESMFEGQALSTAGDFASLMKQIHELVKDDDSFLDFTKLFTLGQNTTADEKAMESIAEITKKIELQGDHFINNASDDDDDDESLPDELSENIATFANQLLVKGKKKKAPVEVTSRQVKDKYKTIKTKTSNQQNNNNNSSNNHAFSRSVVATAVGVFGAIKLAKKVGDLTKTLFDILFGTFEKRAAIVGEEGVFDLLKSLMETSNNNERFHLFGHSLGAHVVLSGSIGADVPLPKKIHTVMLAQGCVPIKEFSKGGMYRTMVTGVKPVSGAILATVFEHDEALIGYDVWMPEPIGRFGFVEDVKPMPLEHVTIRAQGDNEVSDQQVEFRPRTFVNLLASAVIDAHTDVKDREIMEMFWQAASIDV